MMKVRIGKLTDIDMLGSRKVMVRGMEIAVFRLTNNEVMAVENACPHKRGKLSEGMVCGHIVHCPLHDWKIDLHSGLVQEPDEGCVRTFETVVDAETLEVHVLVGEEALHGLEHTG